VAHRDEWRLPLQSQKTWRWPEQDGGGSIFAEFGLTGRIA